MIKRNMLSIWTPRVGPEAALAYWGWQRWLVLGRWSILCGIGIFAIGASLNSIVLEVLAYVLMIGVIVSVFWNLGRAKREFSARATFRAWG